MRIHDAIAQAKPTQTRAITILGENANGLLSLWFNNFLNGYLRYLRFRPATLRINDDDHSSTLWIYAATKKHVDILCSVRFVQRGLHSDIYINCYNVQLYKNLAVGTLSQIKQWWQTNFPFEFSQSKVQDFGIE